MYLPADPFKNCCSRDIVESIYGFNKTYEEDIIELIKILGGPENIVDVKPTLSRITRTPNSVEYHFYRIVLKDYTNICPDLQEAAIPVFRVINGFCHIGFDGSEVEVSAARQMQRLMEEWCDYYAGNEVKIVEEANILDKANDTR